jgi:plasmid stabilization system protein ParE
MPTLIFHDDAERELGEAVDYFEEASPYRGVLFLEAVGMATERLMQYPRAGRKLRGGVRRWVMSNWRYSILYSIEPHGIYVIAVAHQSRRPGYWKHRR